MNSTVRKSPGVRMSDCTVMGMSLITASALILGLLAGCTPRNNSGPSRTSQRAVAAGGSSSAEHGRTYYIDGAGNWGFGVAGVINGLKRAGYKGQVINYRWSPTFNPALDQTVGRPAARAKGRELGREITAYKRQHPDAPVDLIALSAGTGVAVWACEAVQPPATVDDLIMLGSSLSSSYNMGKALENISGGVWVYHSSNDMILQGPVRTLGTIDGKSGVSSAGSVGLRYRSPKIHNIRWSRSYERYGWTGAHTDATSESFVRLVLSRHIVGESAGAAERYWFMPVIASQGSRTGIEHPEIVEFDGVSLASFARHH